MKTFKEFITETIGYYTYSKLRNKKAKSMATAVFDYQITPAKRDELIRKPRSVKSRQGMSTGSVKRVPSMPKFSWDNE